MAPPSFTSTDPDPQRIADRVVAFYRAHRRDFPWRAHRDPYAIWVSEIMAQQTRVATAAPYFERWMARFPTVQALAAASLDEVLAAWSGLGYYRRARNLHRGAREVTARYGGQVPGSAESLRALPGVGRYTAGAIASIAFGERTPVVDGNVARVLARLYALDGELKAAATSRTLWSLADALVPPSAPGDFNQGLMELGATVCTPARPRCDVCPLTAMCRARRDGRQHELPVMPRRRRADELPRLVAAAAWLEHDGRVALARRRRDGLFGGLWELPQIEGDAAELGRRLAPIAALRRGAPVVHHRQVLSHRRFELEVYEARLYPELSIATRAGSDDALEALATELSTRYDRVAWHEIEAVGRQGVASATKAIARRYQEYTGWNRSKQRSATSRRGIKKSSRGFASSATSPTPTKTSPAPRAARPKASPT